MASHPFRFLKDSWGNHALLSTTVLLCPPRRILCCPASGMAEVQRIALENNSKPAWYCRLHHRKVLSERRDRACSHSPCLPHHFYQYFSSFRRTAHLSQECDTSTSRAILGFQAYLKAMQLGPCPVLRTQVLYDACMLTSNRTTETTRKTAPATMENVDLLM
jgi:hypothetical protein